MDTLIAVVWSDAEDESPGAGPATETATATGAATPTSDAARVRAEIAEAVAEPLADLGVSRYVVNVRDAEVEGALIDVRVTPRRLVAAVRARVPVASAAGCADLLHALRQLGPVSAWSVTASEVLPVIETTSVAEPLPPEGVRCEGMANIAFLRRPERIPRQEWLRTWLDHHTTVAVDTQSTTGYTQHVVVRALTDDAPEIDGIVEEIFPIAAVSDLGVFFDAPGDEARMAENMRTMTASTSRFLDEGTVDAVPTGRYEMEVRRPGI
ncbi:hypothetical protein ACWIFB_06275 [Dietzia sp. NPDC055340]